MKEVCGAASPMMENWLVKHQVDGTQLLIHVAILSSQLNLFLASLLQCMQQHFCKSFLVYSIILFIVALFQ